MFKKRHQLFKKKKYDFLLISYTADSFVVTLSDLGVRVMVFNATFDNISAISWQSFLLVEETRVPREKHRPAASH